MAISTESTSIFERIIDSSDGSFPPEFARYVLNLDFKQQDHARYEALSARARDGTLTTEEGEELDGYLLIDSLLSLLRLKASRSLGT